MPPMLASSARLMRAAATRLLGYRRLHALAARGQAPISVLFYHRVCDQHPNDWTISCEGFRRHLDLLRRHFQVLPLEEVQRRVLHRDSRHPAAAITFDDGYADNNAYALPLLVRYGMPCTYFVSVDHITSGRPFPHDVAAGRPLPVNTADDLRHWSEQGIEIGLHTASHFDFSQRFDAGTIQREISDAADNLSDLMGKRVRYFAFPYGMPEQIRPEVIAAVRQAGMLGFCSAYGAYNLPGHDAFHIRRIHGDPEMTRLVNWVYGDRRKLSLDPVPAGAGEIDG